MIRPRLLDLFCGAGGAGMGYFRAGFDVVGVDIVPQKRYPFTFVQADALEYVAAHGHEFDAIHASPPCQAFTSAQVLWQREHPNLIPATRAALILTGAPYAIENVPGAPIRPDVTLCGTMFGLSIPEKHGYLRRHRHFELGGVWTLPLTSPCSHPIGWRSIGVHGHTGGRSVRSNNHGWSAADWRTAMQIDWMTRDELAQAIPPPYTEFIGRQLLAAIRNEVTA